MPRISTIEQLEIIEQPVICIRVQTPVDKLPLQIAQGYQNLGAYLQEIGGYLADMPYVLYHNFDMQNLDVEIGFPVAFTLQGKEAIASSIIPGGKYVFCMYQGPYHLIEPIYKEMYQWIEERGLKPSGKSYEFYYNDTDSEFSQEVLLTKILLPICE